MSKPGRLASGPSVAEARDVGVDQTWVPLRDILVLKFEMFTCRMWRVDDESIGPLDQPFEHFSGFRRFQVERQAALIAVVQVPQVSAFFKESARTFLLVFGRGAETEIRCFEKQALALARLRSLVCGVEREPNGDGGVGTDLLEDGFGPRD